MYLQINYMEKGGEKKYPIQGIFRVFLSVEGSPGLDRFKFGLVRLLKGG